MSIGLETEKFDTDNAAEEKSDVEKNDTNEENSPKIDIGIGKNNPNNDDSETNDTTGKQKDAINQVEQETKKRKLK